MGALTGRKVIVVGASAGIGRAFAYEAIKADATVLAVARRQDKLDELVAEAGGGVTLAADVSNPYDCERIGEAAARELGEVDLLMHCAGVAPLKRFRDMTADDWEGVLATNVVGVHQVIRHVLPVLTPTAIAAVMSSEVVGRPRTALGAYGSSKAALEMLIENWRNEVPGIRFSTIQIGSAVPTEFGNSFEIGLLNEVMIEWANAGLAQAEFMDVAEVGQYLLGIFAATLPFPGICMEHVVVRSPSAVISDAEAMMQVAAETHGLA